ncbi:putative transcription elongation factor S-II, partial [Tetrabaena socialis]
AEDGSGSLGPEALQGLADEVERALFLRHHSVAGQEYKNAARTLVASLKRNGDLSRRVVSGEVRAPQLVAMAGHELATSAQQQEYARLQERETRRVTLNRDEQRVTTEYTCGRCGGNTCDYMDTGRRDIGKCETWGSKGGQGSGRLVNCLSCGNKWDVDDV